MQDFDAARRRVLPETPLIREALQQDLGRIKNASVFNDRAAFALNRLLPKNDARRMLVGVSTNQRMGKPGTFDVWWPKADHSIFRLTDLDELPDLPKLEWAAIWQIELMREAPNIAVEDLEPEHLTKALKDIRKMGSSGHRATIAVAGDYLPGSQRDDLALFDQNLQDKLQQIFALLWLNRISEIYNLDLSSLITRHQWKACERLPHISAMLGATRLFWGDKNSEWYKRKCGLAGLAHAFLEALDDLPRQETLSHEVMLGLYLPQANAEHSWLYIPEDNMKASSFQRFMTAVFSPFDMVSLSGLQSGDHTRREIKASMGHLSGQRNRLNAEVDSHYQRLAALACAA